MKKLLKKYVLSLILVSSHALMFSMAPGAISYVPAEQIKKQAEEQKIKQQNPENRKKLYEDVYKRLFEAIDKKDASATANIIKNIVRDTTELSLMDPPTQEFAEKVIRQLLDSNVVVDSNVLKSLFLTNLDAYQNQILLMHGLDDPAKERPQFEKMYEAITQLAQSPKKALSAEQFLEDVKKKGTAEEELKALEQMAGVSERFDEVEAARKKLSQELKSAIAPVSSGSQKFENFNAFFDAATNLAYFGEQYVAKNVPLNQMLEKLKNDKFSDIQAIANQVSSLQELVAYLGGLLKRVNEAPQEYKDTIKKNTKISDQIELVRKWLVDQGKAELLASSVGQSELDQFLDDVSIIAYFGDQYVAKNIPADQMLTKMKTDKDPEIQKISKETSTLRQLINFFDELLENIDEASQDFKKIIDEDKVRKEQIDAVRKWVALQKQIQARAIDYLGQKRKFEEEFNKRWSLATALLDQGVITNEQQTEAIESPDAAQRIFELEKVKAVVEKDQELSKIYAGWNELRRSSKSKSADGQQPVVAVASKPAEQPFTLDLTFNKLQSPENLLEQVKEDQRHNVTELRLNHNNLTEISNALINALAQFPNIETLLLGGNQLTTVPASLVKVLPKLKILGLAQNNIESLPEEVSNAKLDIINITRNPIATKQIPFGAKRVVR